LEIELRIKKVAKTEITIIPKKAKRIILNIFDMS